MDGCKRWNAGARKAAFAAFVLLAVASGARAQASFGDLSGTWWFALGREDAGALLVAFGVPHDGSIAVESTATGQPSFGFSRALGAFFVVASDQTLGFDSKGNVVGALVLLDPETEDAVGTLTFEKGKANKKFTKWKARASLDWSGGGSVFARLSGTRFPETFPVLSGGNPRMKLSGKGVKSGALDLHVTREAVLGVPAYAFSGAGPVEIDGAEKPSTALAGRFMLSPRYRAFGLVEGSSDFGTGNIKGKLKLASGTLTPKLKLVMLASRKPTVKGKLSEALEPVLSVTPKDFDFGARHLHSGQDRAFAVTNVGAGSLSGKGSFLDGSSADFSFSGDPSYENLVQGSAPHTITLRFEPITPGAKTERILFDVGGGRVGAQLVTLTGVGGIAELSVVPDQIAFADIAVGDEVFETVTVTNAGDGILEGSAEITGSSDFHLARTGSGVPVAKIDYALDPGAEVGFVVRFRPTIPGKQTGTLTLTGGGGATVPLTGATL